MILRTIIILLLASLAVARPVVLKSVWFDDLLTEPDGISLAFFSRGGPNATARVAWAGGREADALAGALAGLPAGGATTGGPPWRKLEFVKDVRPAGSEPYPFEAGVDGIAFSRRTGLAFLPGEVLSRNLVDVRGRWQPERARAYLKEKGRTLPAGARPAFLFTTTAFLFSTTAYLLTGERAVRLFREHRSFPALDRDLLLESARAGGRYLTRNTNSDGRFVYSYFPKTDRVASTYNLVRHAGTVYAMAELFEETGDPDLKAALDRALGFLLRRVEKTGDDRAVVVERGRVKLGGVALAAVALAKYAEVTDSREHVPLLLALGRFIASVQSGDGQFSAHIIDWPGGEVTEFTSDYYPGEALLAYLRIQPFDFCGPWLDRAEKGARWLIEVRDEGVAIEDLNHDHWLLYALRELMRRCPRDLYREHAMKIADAIAAAQNFDPIWPDWRGTWYEPPRSTPAATRSEGLVCAHEIALAAGDQKRVARIERALNEAVSFQLTTQFRPESALHLPSPWRALGGFHRSLTNYEIRIDYVQHNISALLGLRRILGD